MEEVEEIYDFVPCGLFQTSANEVIQKANSTFLSWLGYTQEEVVKKKKWTDFLTMGSKIYHQTHFTPLLNMQGKVEEINFEMRKKDGEKLSVLVNAHLIRKENDSVEVVYYSIYRFTQRKQYEIELLKAKQQISTQNEELHASKEELKMNVEELQAIQNTLAEQNIELEKTVRTLVETQDQLIQSEKLASLGQLIANIAHEINTPLGAIRSSADSIEVILLDTLPNFPQFIKKLDDQTLFEFNEFIAVSDEKIDKLTSRQKRVIKYELIDKLDELAISETEELATIILDMNMQEEQALFMNLLKIDYPNEIIKELFQTAFQLSTIVRSNQTIKEATSRAAKTVFALKNYVGQDHTEEKTNVNLQETLETTITLYHNQTKVGIDVIRKFDENIRFLGYPDEIMQVWTNLIHNAIQAMNGKGKLIITTKNSETQNQQKTVLVSIQDTGTGIPIKIQDKIFDAFFTTKPIGEGSGLGLDITKKIIEKHNGKIWFETQEGIGTTFFIEIPITDNHK